MPAWLLWALAAVALTVGELLTPGLFFLGPIALAALAAMIVAAVGGGWVAQMVVFAGGALAALALLRPIARRHIRMPIASRTGTAKLVGEKALVLERVDVNGGRVKIGGEIWSARTFDAGQILEPGAQVEVAQIEGATALVYQ